MNSNPKDRKVIGILGGMGPYATIDFFKYLVDKTPATKDWHHHHIIIDNNPRIPSRTRAFLYNEDSPLPLMKAGIERLVAAGADVIAVPCNSAHFFLYQLLETVDFPLVDMVAETAKQVSASGIRKVGVMAGEVTVGAQLYERHLDPVGIEVTHVSAEQQLTVRSIIEDVKTDAVSNRTIDSFKAVAQSFQDHGCEGLILGCTELPIIARQAALALTCFDSLDALASAVLRIAINSQDTDTQWSS